MWLGNWTTVLLMVREQPDLMLTAMLSKLTLLALNSWDWGQGNRNALKRVPGDLPSRNGEKAYDEALLRAESKEYGSSRDSGSLWLYVVLRTTQDREAGRQNLNMVQLESVTGGKTCDRIQHLYTLIRTYVNTIHLYKSESTA